MTARPHVSHETYLFLRAERDRLLRQTESVQALADYWFERVTYTAAEIAEMRAKASDESWQRYWDAGMPTEYPLEYSNEGATNA